MSSRADANADRQKFLTKLLGVNESEIASIKERTFKLANAPQNLDTFADLLNDRRKQKIEALSAVLREEDDLGKIVRAHIHIEHELQELIFFAAPNPAHLKSKMDFSEKVQLALVLGMNPELKPA